MFAGYVRAQLDLADGIELIRRGITEVRDTGSPVVLAHYTTWLAIAQ
jgi:hypothetical protein